MGNGLGIAPLLSNPKLNRVVDLLSIVRTDPFKRRNRNKEKPMNLTPIIARHQHAGHVVRAKHLHSGGDGNMIRP